MTDDSQKYIHYPNEEKTFISADGKYEVESFKMLKWNKRII